jgi:hypothetical protein
MRTAAIAALLLLPACAGYIGWGYYPCCYYYDVWSPYGVAAADFDGDAVTDAVVADAQSGGVWLLRGLGGGSFMPPGAEVLTSAPPEPVVRAGFFDAGPEPDLALLDRATGRVDFYVGDGAGGFTFAAARDLGPDVQGLAVVLLDGNALSDLVILRTNGTFEVRLGNGAATFVNSGPLGTPNGSMRVAAGPFDGTPGVDVLLVDDGLNLVHLHSGDGAGTVTFAGGGSADLPTRVRDLAPIVDSGAGRADLLLLVDDPAGGASVAKLPTHGERAWRWERAAHVGNAMQVAAVDLTGDGATDLLVPDPDGQVLRVLFADPS